MDGRGISRRNIEKVYNTYMSENWNRAVGRPTSESQLFRSIMMAGMNPRSIDMESISAALNRKVVNKVINHNKIKLEPCDITYKPLINSRLQNVLYSSSAKILIRKRMFNTEPWCCIFSTPKELLTPAVVKALNLRNKPSCIVKTFYAREDVQDQDSQSRDLEVIDDIQLINNFRSDFLRKQANCLCIFIDGPFIITHTLFVYMDKYSGKSNPKLPYFNNSRLLLASCLRIPRSTLMKKTNAWITVSLKDSLWKPLNTNPVNNQGLNNIYPTNSVVVKMKENKKLNEHNFHKSSISEKKEEKDNVEIIDISDQNSVVSVSSSIPEKQITKKSSECGKNKTKVTTDKTKSNNNKVNNSETLTSEDKTNNGTETGDSENIKNINITLVNNTGNIGASEQQKNINANKGDEKDNPADGDISKVPKFSNFRYNKENMDERAETIDQRSNMTISNDKSDSEEMTAFKRGQDSDSEEDFEDNIEAGKFWNGKKWKKEYIDKNMEIRLNNILDGIDYLPTSISCACFLQSEVYGASLIVGGKLGIIRLLKIPHGEECINIILEGFPDVKTIVVPSDTFPIKDLVFIGCDDGTIKVLSLVSGVIIFELQLGPDGEGFDVESTNKNTEPISVSTPTINNTYNNANNENCNNYKYLDDKNEKTKTGFVKSIKNVKSYNYNNSKISHREDCYYKQRSINHEKRRKNDEIESISLREIPTLKTKSLLIASVTKSGKVSIWSLKLQFIYEAIEEMSQGKQKEPYIIRPTFYINDLVPVSTLIEREDYDFPQELKDFVPSWPKMKGFNVMWQPPPLDISCIICHIGNSIFLLKLNADELESSTTVLIRRKNSKKRLPCVERSWFKNVSKKISYRYRAVFVPVKTSLTSQQSDIIKGFSTISDCGKYLLSKTTNETISVHLLSDAFKQREVKVHEGKEKEKEKEGKRNVEKETTSVKKKTIDLVPPVLSLTLPDSILREGSASISSFYATKNLNFVSTSLNNNVQLIWRVML